MTLSQLQSFLLRGAGLNYATLPAAFAAWALAGDSLYRLHARWFRIDRAQCDAAVYLMLGLYKPAIWPLFITPWIALYIVHGQGAGP